MANIIDYLETEFASFEEKPFNAVDSLILSQLCMVEFGSLVPAPTDVPRLLGRFTFNEILGVPAQKYVRIRDLLCAEHYDTMFTGLYAEGFRRNLIALAASPRFREVELGNYVSLVDTEQQTQFAAMTITYKDLFSYIAYRGTDGSFTSWKENFNMAYRFPVPAQEQACEYVNAAVFDLPGEIYLGGHSKGGNLAVYAGVKMNEEARERVVRIYNHDGPGCKPGSISVEEFAPIKDKVCKTVPQDSVIGMMMETLETPYVVKSFGRGTGEHEAFTWEIDLEKGDFVYLDSVSDQSLFTSETLDEWLGLYSDDARKTVVDAFFDTIEASGAKDATDILMGGPKSINLLILAATNAAGDKRAVVLSALKKLYDIAVRKFGQDVTSVRVHRLFMRP